MRRSLALALALALAPACSETPASASASASAPKEAEPIAQLPPIPVVAPAPPVAEPIAVPAPTPLPATYREAMKLAKALPTLQALSLYEHAAALDPARAAPHIELARLYIADKQPRLARKHVEQAIDLDATSGAFNTLGRIELLDGDQDAAVAAFTRATEVNPDNAFAWNNLGLVLAQLGRHADAIVALERATSGDRPEAYMWTNLAASYEKTDQVELARAAYRQAAKHGSDAAKAALARLDGVVPSTASRPDPAEAQ